MGIRKFWDQKRFLKILLKLLRRLALTVCITSAATTVVLWHDEERNAHLPEDEGGAYKKSYLADMLNGFDLLMIDPTKDPFEIGKVIPLDVVLRRTVDLIEWCEKERFAVFLRLARGWYRGNKRKV